MLRLNLDGMKTEKKKPNENIGWGQFNNIFRYGQIKLAKVVLNWPLDKICLPFFLMMYIIRQMERRRYLLLLIISNK